MNLTDENIKPIPKYMAALIRRTDKKTYPKPCGSARFYAYLTKIQGELVKVTVAVKHCRKKWYCKPVAWHGIHSDKCFVKDLEYCGFVGLGFRIGWHEEGLQSYRKWFERGVCYADDKYYDPWAEIVNPEFVEKFPKYKYSAYKLFRGTDLLKYLRRYEQYPQLEMLMKLGFENIAMSVTVFASAKTKTSAAGCSLINRICKEIIITSASSCRHTKPVNRSTSCNPFGNPGYVCCTIPPSPLSKICFGRKRNCSLSLNIFPQRAQTRTLIWTISKPVTICN